MQTTEIRETWTALYARLSLDDGNVNVRYHLLKGRTVEIRTGITIVYIKLIIINPQFLCFSCQDRFLALDAHALAHIAVIQ